MKYLSVNPHFYRGMLWQAMLFETPRPALLQRADRWLRRATGLTPFGAGIMLGVMSALLRLGV